MPRVLARIGARRTPWVATIAVAIVSLGLFIGSNYVGSVDTILSDAISAIGLQIAVYYGLAGLTVVVAFRKVIFKSAKNAILIGLIPLIAYWILGSPYSRQRPTLGRVVPDAE
jgi:amino acid transporter